MPRFLVPVLAPGLLLCLAAPGLSDEPKPAPKDAIDWVASMRKVRARNTTVPGTFALFGDSITHSLAFWAGLPHARKNLPPEGEEAYKVVQAHMKADCWRGWRGAAFGNEGGMTVRWAHDNVDAWLRKHRPETCLLMFGTNDLTTVPVDEYEKKLDAVVGRCLDAGTVVILSTIPPRSGLLERCKKFNAAVGRVAQLRSVPLVDYFGACLERRPDDWDGSATQFKEYTGYDVPTLIARDGVHPSNPNRFVGDYSEEGRRSSGYMLRNYLTLTQYADVIRLVHGPAKER